MSDAAKKKTGLVTVRATKPGFHLGRRRAGDAFAYEARVDAEGKPVLGSWMELVTADEKPKTKAQLKAEAEAAKKAGTQTFSEGAASTGADLL